MVIFTLVFAGEMIFGLPFHVARFFRPTFMDVFNLSNTALGDIFAMYGIAAILAYFPGGLLADRYPVRKLMSAALLLTGLGGLYMALIPGRVGLSILFAYWGVSTILPFWAAMIRATREWGGKFEQGKAFGFLDGGRGLVAALVASLAVFILSKAFPVNVEEVNHLQRVHALQGVIYLYVVLAFTAAIMVWIFVPESNTSSRKTSSPFEGILQVLRKKVVWLQAAIVVSAYCGYKGLDYYSLYGVEILKMNEVNAAQFVSNAAYLRVVAAIVAGLVVDKSSASRVIGSTFAILILSYGLLGFLTPTSINSLLIFGNLLITFAAVYGLRGVYFALLEETKIAGSLTGTAVGVISLVGFTPDAFFSSLSGRLLDASPGIAGYHHYFLMLTLFALAGIFATIFLSKLSHRDNIL